jgi:hypothetical protein
MDQAEEVSMVGMAMALGYGYQNSGVMSLK